MWWVREYTNINILSFTYLLGQWVSERCVVGEWVSEWVSERWEMCGGWVSDWEVCRGWTNGMGSTQQTSDLSSIFYRSEKKCIFVHFHCVFRTSYVYVGVLRVNIEGFESFSSIWGMIKVQKTDFQTKLDIEMFRPTCLWSENVNYGVKITIPYLFESQINQNGLTQLSNILENEIPIQNSILIESCVLMKKRYCEDLMS